jgi:hypothetical protein
MASAGESTAFATIWIAGGAEQCWTPTELQGAAFELSAGADDAKRIEVRPLGVSIVETIAASTSLLLRGGDGLAGEWCLLSSSASRVNGEPLVLGVRVLENRDEIRFAGGARVYFSTEQVARPERFSGAGRRIVCPRCSCEIAAGDLVVRCPQPSCRLLHHHHEIEQDSCWLSAPACARDGCAQKTSFEVETRWTPED